MTKQNKLNYNLKLMNAYIEIQRYLLMQIAYRMVVNFKCS